VAADVSHTMKMARDTMFTGGKPGGLSISGHEFLTHCELRDSGCAIIIHVPELRRFKADAKEALGELAWLAAQEALQRERAARPGTKLAVGLRGITLYDRVMVGRVVANLEGTDTDPDETHTDSRPEKALYPFYLPAAPSLPAPRLVPAK
jgi:hypothetical protein